MLSRFNSLVIVIVALSVCSAGCDGILSTHERDNPFDPESDTELDPPKITSININEQAEDSIIIDEDHTINLSWDYEYDDRLDDIIEGPLPIIFDVEIMFRNDPKGFNLDKRYYSYAEINSSEISVDLFNDGNFEVQVTPSYDLPEEYIVKEESTGETGDQFFTMDALEEGSLTFLPNRLEAKAGEDFFIDLWIKDIEQFFAGEFKLHFNNDLMQLKGVNQETNAFHNIEHSLAEYHNFNQLVVPDFNDQEQLNRANQDGYLEVSTSMFIDSDESDAYVTGTGSLLRFFYSVPEGVSSGEQAEITLIQDQTTLFGPDDLSIDYQTGENATVNFE